MNPLPKEPCLAYTLSAHLIYSLSNSKTMSERELSQAEKLERLDPIQELIDILKCYGLQSTPTPEYVEDYEYFLGQLSADDVANPDLRKAVMKAIERAIFWAFTTSYQDIGGETGVSSDEYLRSMEKLAKKFKIDRNEITAIAEAQLREQEKNLKGAKKSTPESLLRHDGEEEGLKKLRRIFDEIT